MTHIATFDNPAAPDGFDDLPVIDYAGDMEEIQRDAATNSEPATLERLSTLAAEAKGLERQIAESEENLSTLTERLNKIKRERIPTIMSELNMLKFALADGSAIEVVNVINASLSEERKASAFAWLAANNFDGIIKTKVLQEFGKGDIDKAQEAIRVLNEAGFEALMDRSVHAQTLKAFVKERLAEADQAFDEEAKRIFGVFEFKEAKITVPKVKKTKLK